MAILRCCLCGSNVTEVDRVLVHQNGTAICEECVMCCVEVLALGQDEPTIPDYQLTPAGHALVANIEGGDYAV